MTPSQITRLTALATLALLGCPSTPADTTPPTVSRTVPDRDAPGIATNVKLSIEFSEAMDPASINGDSIQLMAGTVSVSGTVSYNEGEKKA